MCTQAFRRTGSYATDDFLAVVNFTTSFFFSCSKEAKICLKTTKKDHGGKAQLKP